jgi:Uma2 family endonuclease
MSAIAEELPSVPFQGFLVAELSGEVRHEFVEGRVYVMAGGSERHDLAAGLIYRALADRAEAGGCRVFTANRLLRTAAAAYYPDVLVSCGPAADTHYESDASLIVEVASPSTRDVDRREKAAAYAGLPSLQWYVIVDLEARRLEVARPSTAGLGWQAYGAGHTLVTAFGALDVDTLLAAVDRLATT